MERFPQASKLAEGYDVGQVDAFLARLDATLAGSTGADGVSLAEVWGVRFATHRVGPRYDEDAVDAALDTLARQLAQALLSGDVLSASAAGVRARADALLDRLAGPPGTRFPRKRLAHGYLIPAVDALADRIAATLRGADADPCTSADLAGADLRNVIGGYDTSAVDAALAEASEVLAKLTGR
jgi:DivIVA domain-containing protein